MTPQNESLAHFNGTGFNDTDAHTVHLWHALPLGFGLVAFILLGIVGNAMVVMSVLWDRRLRAPTHCLMANLAVADLLLSTVVVPVSATQELLNSWTFGSAFCDVWAALDVLCCTASILSLCVISVDRYVGVSRPLAYSHIVTRRRAVLAAVGVWLVSLLISVGPLFGWKQPRTQDSDACAITEEPFYALFSSLASFYIPLAVILAMYCRVYVVAKRTSRSLKLGVKKERMDSCEVTLRIHQGSRALKDHQPRSALAMTLLKFSREKKAAKTVGVLVGAFTACWLPFFITLPIVSFNAELRPPETLFKFVFWLGYFNSCVNPVIYPCYSREFRQAFSRILRCQWRRVSWRTFRSSSASSGQSRKGSRDSMENYGSFMYGSQRSLSLSSPCPSPSYHCKVPCALMDPGHFHTGSRKNSIFVEGFTDRTLAPVREDVMQDVGQINSESLCHSNEADIQVNNSIQEGCSF